MFASSDIVIHVEIWQAILSAIGIALSIGVPLAWKYGLFAKTWQTFTGKRAAISALILTVLSFIGLGANDFHQSKVVESEYSGYIKAAYNADDEDTAIKYLQRALRWTEKMGIKDGPEQTAVLYESAETNVHDWLEKVEKLAEVSKNGKRNTKQALTSLGLVKGHGVNLEVVVPPDIEKYPLNKEYLFAKLGSGLMGILALVVGSFLVFRRKTRIPHCQYCSSMK